MKTNYIRIIALIMLFCCVGCSTEDLVREFHHHEGMQVSTVTLEQFQKNSGISAFKRSILIPGQSGLQLKSGAKTPDDFIILTDVITETLADGSLSYTFRLMPKSGEYEKVYFLGVYNKFGDWEESIMEVKYADLEKEDMEMITQIYSSRGNGAGTGCITIFTQAPNCNGQCEKQCDRCKDCTKFGSYRVCGIDSGEEYNDPSFTDGEPGGGGGGGNPPPPPPEDPVIVIPQLVDLKKDKDCKKISAVMNDTVVKYKDKVVALALKVTDPVNEHGMVMDNTNVITDLMPSPSIVIDVNPGNPITAMAHIHNNSATGTYSVFSFQDLRILSMLLHNNKLDTDKFVATLSTSKGTHYAITISDKQKFIDFFYSWNNKADANDIGSIDKFMNSHQKADALKKKYYDNSDRLIKENDTNNITVRDAFLSFLQEADMGVTFFKTDAAFSTFTKIYKNADGTVKEESCN